MKTKLHHPLFLLLLFLAIIFSCKKSNDNNDANLTNTGNSGMLPTFSYQVNGVSFIADSFQTILKTCPSCAHRKIYFRAFHNGINNFQLEFLPSLGNHVASAADVAMQYIPPQSTRWISGKNNGVVKVSEVDTLGNIIQGQFSFTDSVYTISEGSFYANRLVRQ